MGKKKSKKSSGKNKGPSAIKIISQEAKRMQKQNPKKKWKTLIGEASQKYRDGKL